MTPPPILDARTSRRQALQSMSTVGLAVWLCSHGLARAEKSDRDAALPPEVLQHLPQAQLRGASRFRHYGFHVYDAQLWVPPGFDAARLFSQAMALCLIYARSLKARDIAERSIEEMRRQAKFSDDDAQRWLQAMIAAFADVRSGDRLTGLHLPGIGASFFLNGQATQTIKDTRFAELFFGIWLSGATSAPALRRELLRV